MRPKIEVCKSADAGADLFFLRVHFMAQGEVIRFSTHDEFTKREADYRAVALSAAYGWERDELPTHPATEAYPKMSAANG